MKKIKLNSEELFFTSDLHFNHAAILKFCSRPYADVEEMNAAIIKNWNSVVPKDGTVVLLGDVSWKGREHTEHLLDQLHGKIIFVEGNHDPIWVGGYFRTFHDHSYDMLLIDVIDSEDGVTYSVHVSHYPLLEWYRSQSGGIHLHGHCHGSLDKVDSKNYQRMDVGVDSHEMFPVSWEQIKTILNQRYLTRNG